MSSPFRGVLEEVAPCLGLMSENKQTDERLFEHFGNTRLRDRGSLQMLRRTNVLATRDISAAFDQKRQVLQDTMRLQGNGSRPPDPVPGQLPLDQSVVTKYEQDVVWGGPIVDHYGHFLLESASRLWPILPGGPAEGAPVVMVARARFPFATEWMDAFGLERLELPRDGLASLSRLIVPEPAWRLNSWISPEVRDVHLHARRGLKVGRHPPVDVLWLSRAQLDLHRRPFDEALLEWILKDHVKVVSPESMTLAEQVGWLEASNVVTGAVGSAFHTTLMCVNPPEGIYLCPTRFQSAHIAQSWLPDMRSKFVHALAGVELRESRRIRFPGEHRLLIPEILRMLDATALPGLLEDRRFNMFAYPERVSATACDGSPGGSVSDLDVLIAKILIDPLNFWERMMLGVAFERTGMIGCAIEQYLLVADLAPNCTDAMLGAVRCLSREARHQAASAMARRALAIDPGCREAVQYTLVD